MRNEETKEITPAVAPIDSVPAIKKIKLTESQEKLLEVLKDAKSLTMTVSAIIAEAGISRQTYYNAFEDDNFVAALESAKQIMLNANEFKVLHNIVNKASDPAVNSHHWAMMVEKMRGRLEEQARKPAVVQVVFNNVKRPQIDITPNKVVVNGEIEEEE